MKLVIIGGGSYVFAPMALYDAIAVSRLSGSEIVLADVDETVLMAMKGYAEGMAAAEGVDIKISAETDWRRALPGADFVVMSAVVQGVKRWLSDYEILEKHGIAHLNRESGGVGGLSYTARSVAFAMDICGEMKRACPGATFLDVANPMPMVVNAVGNYTDISVFGFCSVAYHAPDGYRWFANLVGRDTNEVSVVTAGLNHFAWLVSIRDKASGEDLYGEVVKKVYENSGGEFDLMKKWHADYGGVMAGSISHHADYLPFIPGVKYASRPPFHGSGDERRQRIEALQAVANRTLDYHEVLEHGSWEHPVRFADALYNKKNARFDMINVKNNGYIKGLPDGLTVDHRLRVCVRVY